MTRKQIKRRVFDLLGETYDESLPQFWDDNLLNAWINDGQNWLFNYLPDEAKLALTRGLTITTNTSTSAGDYWYDLTTGSHIAHWHDSTKTYDGLKTHYVKWIAATLKPSGGSEIKMRYIPPDQQQAQANNSFYTGTSTESPWFTVVESKMRVFPKVTATTCAAQLQAICRPRPLTDDDGTNDWFATGGSVYSVPDLAEEYHPVLVLYAAARWKYRDHEYEEGHSLMAQARDELARITADVTAARGVER